MNPLAVIFTLLTGYYLLKLPRTWAPLPLLIGASYMTLGQSISIGPFHFYVIRILITLGSIRVIFREERLIGGWQNLDRMMILWCGCAVLSSFFHENFSAALINRLGFAYDALGLYFLLRIFIRDSENVKSLIKILLIVLVPIAIEMIMETVTGKSMFSFLGGVPVLSEVRDGHVRAQGPFGHSILAGTVGAVCLPLALLFWKDNRRLSLLGLVTTGTMVLTSRSSGPIMTALMACLGLSLWKVRAHMRLIRWSAVLAVITLTFAMNAPVCYVLARIDLTGSSTGWHRAALIDSAFKHLDEWWLGGTDYTRHWMPTGVGWSGDHTDMTNYYLKLGVLGGLPLMLLFIGVLASGFTSLSRVFHSSDDLSSDRQFLLWTLGAVLFGHVATMVSVSYFDQSIVFLYLILASIGSVQTSSASEPNFVMTASICHE
ncbi:MAG: hypothetical protein WCS52_02570 [bacterium]